MSIDDSKPFNYNGKIVIINETAAEVLFLNILTCLYFSFRYLKRG